MCIYETFVMFVSSLTTKIDHTKSADTSGSKNILQVFRDVGMAGRQRIRKLGMASVNYWLVELL